MNEIPLILVSNDDGHLSEGVSLLASALESLGEVWVVAPERERSAVSHSISLHKPLRAHKVAPRRYWVSGTPGDCVYVAVNHLLPRKPSLLVSGVNRGANLGDDLTYSGTVGAAMEGTLLGVPSIAASCSGTRVQAWQMDGAVEIAVRVARQVLENGLPEMTFLNLNVPNAYDPSLGVEVTKLGRRNYGRAVQEGTDPRGRRYLWIGGVEPVHPHVPGSDCEADDAQRASLTPITLDLTRHDFLAQLRTWTGLSEKS